MKYRCPHCGNTFSFKRNSCPTCGNIMHYEGDLPSVSQQMDGRSDEKLSFTPFNVWNLLGALAGLAFSLFALFGPIYIFQDSVRGVTSISEFSLLDYFIHFVQNFNDVSMQFANDGALGGLKGLLKDILPLLNLGFVGISCIVQFILLILGAVRLLTKTEPPVARCRNMGNQGQLRGCIAILILSYGSVFVPFILGLIYRNTMSSDSTFNDIARAFIDDSRFHGLTYWHLLFLFLFSIVVLCHVFRRIQQKKLQFEKW